MPTSPRHRTISGLLLSLVLLAPLGCGEEGITPGSIPKPIPLSDVPEVVMKAAKAELRGVTIKDARQNLDKGGALQSYEIRGQRGDGKISEVRVSPEGKILEREG